jgi:phosphoribosylamine--glycine ligase
VTDPEVQLFHAGTDRLGGRLVSSGGRVLGVSAVGDDLDGALARAYRAVEAIGFEGAHFRRDIGRRPGPKPATLGGTDNGD